MKYRIAAAETRPQGLTAWWRRVGVAAAIGLIALQPVPLARACGYEAPASIALGALNFTYPNALWVGTAVWQARQEGLLPAAKAPASGPDAALKMGQDGRLQAMQALYQLRRRLGNDPAMPPLSVVFTPAVMWSRLAPQPDKLSLKMHVSGPETDDVVLVTETVALQAWLSGRLTSTQLMDNGLVRLYGSAAAIVTTRSAFAALDAQNKAKVGALAQTN